MWYDNVTSREPSMAELKRYKITITITTTDGAIDTKLAAPIWSILDESKGERLDSVSLPSELPLITYD